MRIGMLGPLEVLADGRPVEIGGARLRVLLTLLALDPGSVLPAERIIDALWEDDVPGGAANALQSLVSRLRALVGRDAVESRFGGYRLTVRRGDVDVHDFEARVAAARAAAAPAERSAGLGAALALWRGPALADAAGLRFADAPAARLEALRRAALEERLDADLALGRHARLIPELQALAAQDPLREPVTALLMRALYAAGHQAEALAAYDAAKHALGEVLGVDPSPALEAVYLAVLRQDASLRPAAPASQAAPAAPAAPPPPDDRKGNLRARLTSFIGRDADLGRVDDLLSRARLVTLIGPGGSGKTRLSLESGERLAGRMPDGAWLVELAPVADPAEVPAAALGALGALGLRGGPLIAAGSGRMAAPDTAEPLERLVSALAGRRLLLVLDNCEHLLDAAARLADQVLAACPGVRILATSREPLGITGETLWPVEPLELPPPSADAAAAHTRPAVRLFADRAAAVSPGFAVTEDNAGWIVRICRALDGMPLAIELAAARLSAMTPEQVAVRLDDRFRLLNAGSRTALPRHKTLRAVVEWSWDLLAEPERALWRRLAVFHGGATLEAAEDVCAGPGLHRADVLDVLSALVDKSLVTVSGTDGGPRYRMLETLRAYGLERLVQAGEEERTRRAHADHFLRLAEEAEPHLYRADQIRWLPRLAAEHDNCAAALRWAVSVRDAPLALRFCAALGWSWFLRGRLTEGTEHLEEILDLPGVPADQPTAMAFALASLTALDKRPNPAPAATWLRRAQEIGDGIDDRDLHPVLWLMLFMGKMQVDGWNLHPAEGIERLLDSEDPWARGLANFVQGHIAHNFGRTHLIEDFFDRALAGFREAGDRWGLSFALTAQGEILSRRGEHAGAVARYEESLRLNAELGRESSSMLYVTMRLGNELDLMGESARARALLLRSMEQGGASRSEETMALNYQLAEIARRAGDSGEALRGLTLAEDLSAGLSGPPQFRAMLLSSRAQLDIALGAVEEARARLDEAVRIAVQSQDYPILSYVLGGHAELCRALGDAERAAVLLGAADGLRGTRDLSQPDVLAIEAAVREALGEPAFTAANERGRSWTFTDIVEAFDLPHP
ncbi:BTAD domain-containing putative transcriptional regulator [Actinomadura sp. NEAU-AAG7]|uniref:BTAD domain-containing putative transcriptional regulator n=1 Tax=Actinomadura sp. NEAU-AAG7 TaxID=2839640 RepID=UPI001BE432B7|nr:BTAD domain-containing putative transcriptional regulator [Actinomadura sp. NEAU-AAG7]MBT2211131.1 winged helix-turn-helix domain-containing protein [Actinomadura sp. NEAU-AAG7]